MYTGIISSGTSYFFFGDPDLDVAWEPFEFVFNPAALCK